MDVWLLMLYAAAAFLALRSLVSLMVHHKAAHQQKLIAEQQARQKRSRKLARQEAERAA